MRRYTNEDIIRDIKEGLVFTRSQILDIMIFLGSHGTDTDATEDIINWCNNNFKITDKKEFDLFKDCKQIFKEIKEAKQFALEDEKNKEKD